MLQIPFISTIGGSHSDHSVSNALGEHRRERESEGGRVGWISGRVGEGRYQERGERTSFWHTGSRSSNATFRCFHQSQPQNSHVLVSSLSSLTTFHVRSSSGRICFVEDDLLPPSLPCHPLSSSSFLFCPPLLSVFVLSVNVLDGGLSPGKHHYSNFLCNMNDGDPLFISDLLITLQPIAYPPRQGSHSHSRHYFIKRVRLQWAVVNNAVIRCGASNGLGSSSERRAEWVSLLPGSKLPSSVLARKGQHTAVQVCREFLYNFCPSMERRRGGSKASFEHLLFSKHGKWCVNQWPAILWLYSKWNLQ